MCIYRLYSALRVMLMHSQLGGAMVIVSALSDVYTSELTEFDPRYKPFC